APWAMAVGARLRDSLGIEVQSIWSDDGIAFHLPDADAPPSTDTLLLDAGELDELVLAEVGQTALFGARFRENAARALLIPRRAQALSLDRDLLRELLGQEELRELIDPDALADVERSLRPQVSGPDHLHDLLRLRGDLRRGEFDEAHAAILEAERRAIRVRVA